MAKRRFRLDKITPEQKTQIDELSRTFSPYQDDFLNALESGKKEDIDNLFNSVAGRFTESEKANVQSRIGSLSGGLKSRKDALKDYIKSQTDVPNLTTADIEERVGVLQEIGSFSSEERGLNPDALRGRIKEALQGFIAASPGNTKGEIFVPDNALNDISNIVADEIVNNRYEPQHLEDKLAEATPSGILEGQKVKNHLKAISRDLAPIIQRELNAGKFNFPVVPAQDTTGDIKIAQDILADRAKKAAAGADITKFFETEPGVQTTKREAFFGGLRERAKDFVSSEYAPRVKESLRSRGLARSGQVADTIISKYADLFGDISEQESAQLQDDIDFFKQQQYDKVFGDLVNAGQDVAGVMGTERDRLRLNQISDFGKRQADIESKFNLDLFKDQSRLAYETFQKQIDAQSRSARERSDAETYGQIGSVLGNVGGVYLGSLK